MQDEAAFLKSIICHFSWANWPNLVGPVGPLPAAGTVWANWPISVVLGQPANSYHIGAARVTVLDRMWPA